MLPQYLWFYQILNFFIVCRNVFTYSFYSFKKMKLYILLYLLLLIFFWKFDFDGFFKCWCSHVLITKIFFYLFRESLVDASIRLCTGLFLYKHMHKTSNCLILFLIEVVQFFSIVLYYIVSFHSEYSNSIHGFYVQLGSFTTIWTESFSNYQYWRNVNLKKANL